MIRLEMKKYNDIKIGASNISALSSGKIDEYEYLTSKEQARFTYSPFKKTKKATEDQGEKQTKTIENIVEKQLLDRDQKSIFDLFSKDILTGEAIYELKKTKK